MSLFELTSKEKEQLGKLLSTKTKQDLAEIIIRQQRIIRSALESLQPQDDDSLWTGMTETNIT